MHLVWNKQIKRKDLLYLQKNFLISLVYFKRLEKVTLVKRKLALLWLPSMRNKHTKNYNVLFGSCKTLNFVFIISIVVVVVFAIHLTKHQQWKFALSTCIYCQPTKYMVLSLSFLFGISKACIFVCGYTCCVTLVF